MFPAVARRSARGTSGRPASVRTERCGEELRNELWGFLQNSGRPLRCWPVAALGRPKSSNRVDCGEESTIEGVQRRRVGGDLIAEVCQGRVDGTQQAIERTAVSCRYRQCVGFHLERVAFRVFELVDLIVDS